MNTQVHKDFTFLASIHFEKKFMANLYEMSATMIIETSDVQDQNVAIERMNYFLGAQIEDCIFIHDKEVDAIEKYQKAGIKTCIIPEEPYDQIIGLILMNKCNAIMEGRIVVTEIIFGSKLSSLIKFNITNEAASVEYPGKFWWNDSSLSIQNKKKKDKIVTLFDENNWSELELTWSSK